MQKLVLRAGSAPPGFDIGRSVSGHAKMPPASHQVSATSLKLLIVKPPRRDTRALSPAGMFGGKAPLRLAAQKSRPHAPSVRMRSAPACFLCKWGV